MAELHSFHFDHVHLRPEQQVAWHQQSSWELSYIISGEGERVIGSTREPFHEGEVVLVVPQMPHCWTFDPGKTDADGKIENITITFSGELLEKTARAFPETRRLIDGMKDWSDSVLFVSHTSRRLAGLMQEMLSQPPAVRLFVLLQMIMLMAASGEHQVVGRPSLPPAEQQLQAIETFVSCNFRRQVSLADLARHAGMNQTALCKFLRRQLGKTFVQYINERRLAEARYLLTLPGLSVGEVCYRSGFNDVPYFCRLFKKAEGLSPMGWRRLHAGGRP